MKDLLELAITSSLLAGKEILKIYDTDFEILEKKDNSPLTIADKNAHLKIVETPYEERKNGIYFGW